MPHLKEFGVGRRPILQPHDLHPDVAIRNQVSNIQRRGTVETGQIFWDRAPAVLDRVRVSVEPGGVSPHVVERGRRGRGEGDAVLSINVRGDPLLECRPVDGVGQKHEIAVHVGVDETGNDVEPRRVEHLNRLGAIEATNLRDGGIEQADIGPKGGGTGAVDNLAAPDQQIEPHESLTPRRGRAGFGGGS